MCASMTTIGPIRRLVPGSLRRDYRAIDELGAGLSRQERRRRLPAGTEAERRHGRLAPPRRHRGADPRRRLRSLEEGQRAAGPHRQAAAARRQGPHGMGDAQPAQGRPHRLPLADPALHRSQCGISLRPAVGGHGRRRTVQRDALRHRGRVLEPSRRYLHLRHHDRGVRRSRQPHCCSSPRSCAAPTRRAPTSLRNRQACLPRRSATRACTGTISRNSRRPWASTMPCIAGAGMRPAETHNWPSAKPGA